MPGAFEAGGGGGADDGAGEHGCAAVISQAQPSRAPLSLLVLLRKLQVPAVLDDAPGFGEAAPPPADGLAPPPCGEIGDWSDGLAPPPCGGIGDWSDGLAPPPCGEIGDWSDGLAPPPAGAPLEHVTCEGPPFTAATLHPEAGQSAVNAPGFPASEHEPFGV
jgi:hypothetical protein